MIERIIGFAIERRWLVMAGILGFVVFGLYQYRHLPIDAVPDITSQRRSIAKPMIRSITRHPPHPECVDTAGSR